MAHYLPHPLLKIFHGGGGKWSHYIARMNSCLHLPTSFGQTCSPFAQSGASVGKSGALLAQGCLLPGRSWSRSFFYRQIARALTRTLQVSLLSYRIGHRQHLLSLLMSRSDLSSTFSAALLTAGSSLSTPPKPCPLQPHLRQVYQTRKLLQVKKVPFRSFSTRKPVSDTD